MGYGDQSMEEIRQYLESVFPNDARRKKQIMIEHKKAVKAHAKKIKNTKGVFSYA